MNILKSLTRQSNQSKGDNALEDECQKQPKNRTYANFHKKTGPNANFDFSIGYMQVTLENYYNNLISQHRERRDRLKRLEESLNENGLSETVCYYLFVDVNVIEESLNENGLSETVR